MTSDMRDPEHPAATSTPGAGGQECSKIMAAEPELRLSLQTFVSAEPSPALSASTLGWHFQTLMPSQGHPRRAHPRSAHPRSAHPQRAHPRRASGILLKGTAPQGWAWSGPGWAAPLRGPA